MKRWNCSWPSSIIPNSYIVRSIEAASKDAALAQLIDELSDVLINPYDLFTNGLISIKEIRRESLSEFEKFYNETYE